MENNRKMVPKRRFKEFQNAGDWEQRKLGDVVQITMGQSPDGNTYSDEPSDYILVQGNSDLQNGWVCPRIWTTQITKKADAGDLIMGVRAPAGAMGKTAYNAVIGRGVAAIKGNEFIYQLLVKMDADGFWKTISCGSTFESLNSDNIKNAEVKIPTTAEQIKIGGYFQQLDNLITLHQRKLDKIKAIKKAYLSEMFPQNGEKKPRRRFKGFTDDWEQRKLGDIFIEYSEKNHTELPPLTIVQGKGTIRRDESDRQLQFDESGLSSYKMVDKDDFIVHLRSFEGGLEKANSVGIVSPAYHMFHGVDIDPRLYYEYFRSYYFIKVQLIPHVYGIRDGRSIDIEGMKSIKIPYPNLNEQKRIGDSINELNKHITLHQRKLEKLKNIKKAYLNEMFV